ncbi:hypothetical protein A5739_06970 [Mycobacterium colombiense]|uniref:Uncharacterized protein n=1 Tax=Mycolicibacterium obuense TaxID=1807 RepID=A0A0M2JUU5_9MYCO|nr:hypothetical protein WN67_19410 [Mycolicibacterium obuense]OMC33622.1 hypothetical protein A5739_06970 [Mycobacterium colombiense]
MGRTGAAADLDGQSGFGEQPAHRRYCARRAAGGRGGSSIGHGAVPAAAVIGVGRQDLGNPQQQRRPQMCAAARGIALISSQPPLEFVEPAGPADPHRHRGRRLPYFNDPTPPCTTLLRA